MKKFLTFSTAVLLMVSVFAQAPEKMSYQAVIRNSSDELVKNTQIGMQISILKASASGTAVYVEKQTPTTNINGLVSIEIGVGTVVIGSFATIDWGNNLYFIKTEIDPSGGTNYTISGTTQLLSVPYALYAKNAKTYKVGDFAHGGIVFYVDNTGQHGLVCAKSDQSNAIKWNAGTFTKTIAKGDGIKAGFMNTAIIVARQGEGDGTVYAARCCNELKIKVGGITYGDWYLPSLVELQLMYRNKEIIDSVAVANGGGAFFNSTYWSSFEENDQNAWFVDFNDGAFRHYSKDGSLFMRAVRAF